jgi:gas vesicle protein
MDMERDHQYDLLTAAIIGAAVGATATLLVAAGMKETRRTPTQRMVRRGRKWVSSRRNAIGSAVDPSAVRDQMEGVIASARDAISDTVESELKDLRKAMRRQRRRLGI